MSKACVRLRTESTEASVNAKPCKSRENASNINIFFLILLLKKPDETDSAEHFARTLKVSVRVVRNVQVLRTLVLLHYFRPV